MFEDSSQNYKGAAAVAQQRQSPMPQSGGGRTTKGRQKSILEKIRDFRVEFAPSRKDILNFTNQLAVMVKAGISLTDCLESISQQTENRKFTAVITDLKDQIETGKSFSQALAEHGQTFGSLYVNMVASAEISGSLSEMLQKLAEYLDTEAETRSQVKSAMVYPIIIA
ncbi:unnamed protein product, partial [marine sediment metagenome]